MSTAIAESEFKTLHIDQIHLAPEVLRQAHVKDENKENSNYFALKESIKQFGQITPILVRPHPTIENAYELVNGAQRLSIVKSLGNETIRAEVRDVSDVEFLDIQLQSNRVVEMKTKDYVNYVMLKQRQLLESTGKLPTVAEIAALMRISKDTLEAKLHIGRLPGDVVKQVDAGNISAGHAKRLADLTGKIPEDHFRRLVDSALRKVPMKQFEIEIGSVMSEIRKLKKEGLVDAKEETLLDIAVVRTKDQIKSEYLRFVTLKEQAQASFNRADFADDKAFEDAVARKVGDFNLGYLAALEVILQIDAPSLKRRAEADEARKRQAKAKKAAASADESSESDE